MPLGSGSQLDPAAARVTFAYTQRDGDAPSVVVRPGAGPSVRYANAESPSLDGQLLAYADAAGIRVVRWLSGKEAARIPGALSKPALDWPLLVFRRKLGDGRTQLRLRNLETGVSRRLTTAGAQTDLGRPSIGGGRVAWHVANGGGSRIVLYHLATGTRRVLFRTKIALVSNPALTRTHVVWIQQRQGISSVNVRRISGRTVSQIASVGGNGTLFWTTDAYDHIAYVTRWRLSTGAARILQIPF